MKARIASTYSPGVPRVGLLASRDVVGAPLKAAAGQATVVKLQTLIESSNVWM
jgi:hypothetical protein